MEKLQSERKNPALFAAAGLLGAFFLGYPKLIPFDALDGVFTVGALVLFMVLTDRAETKKDYLFLFGAFALGYTCRFYGLLGKPWYDVPLGIVVSGIVFPLFLMNKRADGRMHPFLHVFVFPFLWTAEGLLFGLIRVPALMRLDWAFSSLHWFVQCISLVTVYGFTFLVLLISGFLACFFTRKKRWGLFAALGLAAAMTAYGLVALRTAPASTGSLRVACTTGPYVGDFMNYTSVDFETRQESIETAAETAADGGAAVLVFNEESFEVRSAEEETRLLGVVREAAKGCGLHILVGLDTVNEATGLYVNKLVWVDSAGAVRAEYTKRNTIPLIEGGYERGEGEIPSFTIEVEGQQVRVAFAICYDSNSPNYLSGVKDSADILFLPSWDWKGVSVYHYRLCENLAVQCGFTVVKPTYDGWSVVIDRLGRILWKANTADTGFETVQFVEVPF